MKNPTIPNTTLKNATSLSIWLALLTVYLVWGSTYLAIRFAVETLPPFYMASARFLIAGSLLYLFRRLRGDPTPTFKQWRASGVVGFCLLVIGNGGVVWAEQRVPSAMAALIIGTVPLWIILFDRFIQKSHLPSIWTTLGVILGFLGIVLLFWPGKTNQGAGPVDLSGALVLLLAASGWAYGSLYSRTADLPASPLMGTAAEMLVGGLGLLVAGTAAGDWAHLSLQALTLKAFLSVGYLILFGSLIGYAAYTWLLRVAPTSVVSTYAYVNPVVALGLGTLIGGELLSTREIAAAAIIIGSVVLTGVSRSLRRPAEKQEAGAGFSGED